MNNLHSGAFSLLQIIQLLILSRGHIPRSLRGFQSILDFENDYYCIINITEAEKSYVVFYRVGVAYIAYKGSSRGWREESLLKSAYHFSQTTGVQFPAPP